MSEKIKSGGLVDMTTGSPLRHIVSFSIPLLIGNVFQQLYNVVDSIVVGNFTGDIATQAQAAVNTAMPIIFLMVALFMGLGMGANIILSQNFGAGEMDAVRKTVSTLYSSMMIICIPLTIVGVVFAPALIDMVLNVPEDVSEMARQYLMIICAGLVGAFGYNINAGILQGLGDSKSPLMFLIISCIINIILDLLFVIVFHMAVVGVALATIIAQMISWLYGVWRIRKKYPELDLNPFRFKIDGEILRKSVRLGLPAGLQQSLFSIGSILMQRLVNQGDAAFIAGFGNANRVDAFVFLPIFSFSAALTTFTGQNMGVGQIDRVKKGLRGTIWVSLATYTVLAALVLIFARGILGFFNKDGFVIDAGMYYLYEILPFTFLIAIQFMLTSVLRGAGSAMIPLFTTMIAFMLVRIPSAYIIEHFFELKYIYLSYPIGWVIGLSISVGAYLSGKWQSKSLVIHKETPVTEDI